MQYDLAIAALSVSTDEYPGLDINAYLNRLDAYADVIRTRLPMTPTITQIVDQMISYLFEELGFSGNTNDYYDPRNSYLNDVMDRRLGIPITLSLIFIEIGKRLGVNAKGVSFPGHFLVKCDISHSDFLIVDPFDRGKILDRDYLESRMENLYGDHPAIRKTLDALLEGATHIEFLNRILNNLKAIYISANNYEKALYVSERIVKLRPDLVDEVRDRGKIYMALDCFAQAIKDLQTYYKAFPDAEDSDEIHEYLVELYKHVKPNC